VAWVESASPSFRARHESTHADDVDWVLYSLERTRKYLGQHFPHTVDGMSVVFHSGAVSLSIACPMVPLAWVAAAPAARRYVAGWTGRDELHILRPDRLEARGSAVPGSREMLATTASTLYARRVIIENNPDVPLRMTPRRVRAELRWAWLIEGAARWFGGQTAHARPAIARRLREGGEPDFPPGIRDAQLLGGTVLDLLAREEGAEACVELLLSPLPRDPRVLLRDAFGGRSLKHTEAAWRGHLRRLVA
jgi:hypothetical protein